jgi:lantibiotic modifying enzyme
MEQRIHAITQTFNNKLLACDLQEMIVEEDGLMGGRLGLIYYFSTMYRLEKKEIYLDKIADLLSTVFANSQQEHSAIAGNLSFSDGLCGLGFVINDLLKQELLEEDFREQLIVINDLALDYSLEMVRQENYDYFYGPTGSLFYLTEVGQLEYCERILTALFEAASKHNFLFYSQHEDSGNRGFNFGFAHGNPALFKVLLNLVEKGMKQGKLEQILHKGIAGLLRYKNSQYIAGEDIQISFPHNILIEEGIEKRLESIVLGWCNSELDMSLLLLKYSELFDKPEYVTVSHEVGIEAARRKTVSNTGVTDAHFCHGSSGVAQLFKKLFEMSGLTTYGEAYSYWLEKTLGYLEAESDEPLTKMNVNFLYGSLAPILTINESRSSSIAGWDRLFLL